LDVVENEDYNGNLCDVRPNFKQKLTELVRETLSPEHLIVKKINGIPISCRDLFTYFEAYTKIYQSDQIPEPRTALEATAQANNINVKEEALRRYDSEMEKMTHGSYIYPEQFMVLHQKHKKESLDYFTKAKKLGGKEFSQKFYNELVDQIEKSFVNYNKVNETKGALAAIKTPLALALLFIISYILSHFWVDMLLELFYMTKLALFLDFVFWVTLLCILTYMACKVSGVDNPILKDAMRQLDIFSELLWEHVFSKIGKYLDTIGLHPSNLLTKYAQSKLKEN